VLYIKTEGVGDWTVWRKFGTKGGSHATLASCHHGMVHSQVVDGEEVFQIWRVAANTLNKQS